jgi:hypothetical protein
MVSRWSRVAWCLLLFSPWVAAEPMRLSYGLERFLWEEFDNGGQRLLDESGFRHVFALRGVNAHGLQLQSDFNASITFGTVAYDGQTQSGVPVSTDTDYRGYGLEAGITYFPGGEAAATGPGGRVALGLDTWERSLQGAGGYDEHYMVTYGRLAGVYAAPPVWWLEFGAKLPLAISERVDLSDYGYAGEVNLKPEGRPSLYLTWRYQLNARFDFSLSYDGYLFAKSDDEIVYNEIDGNYYAIHQPRSEMQTLGLTLTLSL